MGLRRGSSKNTHNHNAGEIVIEDQGTATPKYPGFVSTPQSVNEDQHVVFETTKARKKSVKNQQPKENIVVQANNG